MPKIFEFEHTVHPSEIDSLGHANNVSYVQWMQSAALAHSAAQGWSHEAHREFGYGWVVRSHGIEYHQPAMAGDRIVIRTWVATMKKVTSLRRYRIIRVEDEELLAIAETNWAFINYSTGQPVRIPPEVADAFVVVKDE